MRRYGSVLGTIGNTPVIKINSLYSALLPKGSRTSVWIKHEGYNPGRSIKDRIALRMIEEAEKKGYLIPGKTVVIEPTSGNTGIGLAMVCAVKRYPCKLVMPETMSVERQQILQAYGAEVILTPREIGASGSVKVADRLAEEIRQREKDERAAWIPSQFHNPSNPQVHMQTTSQEILEDFRAENDRVDYLFCSIGTGGHLTGCARVLRTEWPTLKVIAVEPAESFVVREAKQRTPESQRKGWSPHKIMGVGADFLPGNCDVGEMNEVVPVESRDAYEYAVRCGREEGMFVGISTGAVLAGIAAKLQRKEIEEGSTLLTFAYDIGDRYLSVKDLFHYKRPEMLGEDLPVIAHFPKAKPK